MLSAVSDSFTVENYVTSLLLTATNETPSLNFTMQIDVTLKGNDNNLFPGTCSVELTGSNLKGSELTKSITSGEWTFDVYFDGIGEKTVQGSCLCTSSGNAETDTLLITVLANILKITPTALSVKNI